MAGSPCSRQATPARRPSPACVHTPVRLAVTRRLSALRGASPWPVRSPRIGVHRCRPGRRWEPPISRSELTEVRSARRRSTSTPCGGSRSLWPRGEQAMQGQLLCTTVVGSYPQPDWLIDRQTLGRGLVPRVPARELWRIPDEVLEQAQDDATLLAVRAMEQAGVDIISD